ncbi:MAG: YigZ family protein [Candidatus Krumholzibacteriia bacterium]
MSDRHERRSPGASPKAPTSAVDGYATLAAPGTAEVRVQRSRFVALAAPVADAATARALVAEIGRRHHDARHLCHGWRLGPEDRREEARNDGGEPAGTAGEPILAAIRKADLSDCVVAVVRYFGGIKLGTGGLARAYGDAAAAALSAGERTDVKLGHELVLRFPYARQKTVQHLLLQHAGESRHEVYDVLVTWRIWLPRSRWRAFLVELPDATAGEAEVLSLPGDDAPPA